MKIFPVFIPFAGCQIRCIYCQQNLITRTGSSEKSEESSTDFAEIKEQLVKFCARYPGEDKQIAFYGGSFTLLPFEIQENYLKEIAEYLPLIKGIRISTRPDGINRKILDFALRNRITTIELGIQSFNDTVLKKTGRPYNSEEAVKAAGAVKEAGIELGIQLMPGLPGETAETINETIEKTISCHPDIVRIYPTLVLKNTLLEKMHREGIYKPLTLEEGVKISAEMIIKLRSHNIKVIKAGLHSDLSHTSGDDESPAVVAGPYHPAFGELVSQEILYHNIVKSYLPGKTLILSNRAVSLLRRDRGSLVERIKKNLSINALPIDFREVKEKEQVLYSDQEPGFLW